MKHLFTLLVFLSVTIITIAQPATMLEKEQQGIGIAAGLLLSEHVEGISFNGGFKFTERTDLSVTIGKESPNNRNGFLNGDYSTTFYGLETSFWFISREVGSDALFKTGLIVGGVYGDADQNILGHQLSTLTGLGGLGVMLNYNPGNGFFILQPSVASAYSAGWEYARYDDYKNSMFIDQIIVTGSLAFGFKLNNGSVLSLNVSKGYSDTLIDPFGFGVEFALPVN